MPARGADVIRFDVAASARRGEHTRPGLVEAAGSVNASRLKRGTDVVVAFALLMFFLPTLVLLALLIYLESGGPIIFRQERYGAGRKIFKIYKFRTMTVTESTGGFVQAFRGDSRVTAVGRVLRRTSLDELPQLLNVLKGEMSLVGPRPHAVAMDDAFEPLIPEYSSRHLVRPGITGQAQVYGHRGPTESVERARQRVLHDVEYIERWSYTRDLTILAKTPVSLLSSNAL
jgi:putative colanic acid biosynthesis UDP-glucose lipid carrier transferase